MTTKVYIYARKAKNIYIHILKNIFLLKRKKYTYIYKKSKRLNSWLVLFWIGARFEDSNTGNARKRNQVVSVEKSRIQREVKDE